MKNLPVILLGAILGGVIVWQCVQISGLHEDVARQAGNLATLKSQVANNQSAFIEEKDEVRHGLTNVFNQLSGAIIGAEEDAKLDAAEHLTKDEIDLASKYSVDSLQDRVARLEGSK